MNHTRNKILNKLNGKISFLKKSHLAALFIYIVIFNVAAVYSQTEKEIEYRLKAVYLFNFMQFIEWPDYAFKDESAPIIVALIGDDPFGKILDETIQNEKIGDHSIVVKRYKSYGQINLCHVLFISSSEEEIFSNILKMAGKSPILTVSDIDKFSEEGGNIGFYFEQNKIRFAINLQSLKQADLKASSKLLRLAKVINPI